MTEAAVVKKSLTFLQDCFREWYKHNQITLPDRFGRREFAFVFFGGKGMMRHLSFNRKKQLEQFMYEKAPAHAYYSSAYYQKPDAPTMMDKTWMGAELIFDLDADHLPNVEKIPYAQQLELVKKEFIKLVEDFLMNDFGFEEKYLELYFSGGRGYHCHVKDPRIFSLNSNERREIVDYITGRDLKDSLLFQEEITNQRQYGRIKYPTGKTLKMPGPEEPGWRGRISRGLIDIVEEIINSDDPVEKLGEYGVKRTTAEKLLDDLTAERIERIKQGKLDQSKTIRKFFLNNALRKTAVSFAAGETDEPVTCDVKRLIRLPASLHGKTGLKVTKISLDDLKTFNPLIDAVVFPDDPVMITLHHSVNFTMNREQFHLEKGEHEVPMYAAVFLIGRKTANILAI